MDSKEATSSRPAANKMPPNTNQKRGPAMITVEDALGILDDVRHGTGSAPVLVCMDIETFEFNSKILLEIGLAILDLQDLTNQVPGDRGEAWASKIQYHHLLASNNAHLSNKVHCKGCPDGFLFGDTVKMHANQFPDHIERLLVQKSLKGSRLLRPMLLVGHAWSNDDRILRDLGFMQWPPSNSIGAIDTQKVANTLIPFRFNTSPGLSRLLEGLGIPYANMHNGGNDAAFTMRALLALYSLSPEQKAWLMPRCLPSVPRCWAGPVEPQIEVKPPKRRPKLYSKPYASKTTQTPKGQQQQQQQQQQRRQTNTPAAHSSSVPAKDGNNRIVPVKEKKPASNSRPKPRHGRSHFSRID